MASVTSLRTSDETAEATIPAARPQSATGELTAMAGLAAAIAAMLLLRSASIALPLKALVVVAATAAPMALIELQRPHERFRTSAAPNPLSINRLYRKLVGFWATIGMLYGIYSVLPEYEGSFYAPVWAVARACLPWLALASPLYIFYFDRRQADPEDGYAQLGGLLTAQGQPADWGTLAQYARGWIVKGFFLPLMFVYLVGNLDSFWRADLAAAFSSFGPFYQFSYNILFLFDLLFAVVGYALTLRLLGSHIRSADPTLTGWVVCLMCYQPFWSVVGSHYLRYEGDDFYWGNIAGGQPVLYVAWGTAILCCLAVYSLATVSFGLRFSNLTHRGIITTGPYRFTKHPAYVAKCASFWLISIPFLSNHGLKAAVAQTLLLILANAVYVARAITEERHLARDPVYRAYQEYIRREGLLARLARLVSLQQERQAAPRGKAPSGPL